MSNLSKKKRQEMIDYINKLKEIHKDDESIIALNNIENAITEKKYGLVWEEHSEKVDEMLENNIPVFTEVENKKIEFKANEDFNFLLEGDNLHSLKLLEKTHKGEIDVIYIDPPYNTKNKEFIYDDCMIGKDDTYRHSKWLSFMERRLIIARELLSNDGVIFISIDDNEQAQLRLLCNEIFGENNFIETFCWNKTTTPPSLSKTSRSDLEYIHVFQRTNSPKVFKALKPNIKSTDSPIQNRDNPIGTLLFRKGEVICNLEDGVYEKNKYGKGKLLDNLIVRNRKNIKDFRYRANLKWSQEYLENEIKNGTKILIKSNEISIRYKKTPDRKKAMTPNKLIDGKFGVGTNDDAKSEMDKLNLVFSYPKPVSLIKYLVNFIDKNDTVVLDFFAGSGTTGNAVMQLNREDGGKRKYILCTNNENNIAEAITYKRLKNIQEDLPHNLKYLKTDYIKRFSDEEDILSERFLSHIKEMVELENMCEIDGKDRILILSQEELEEWFNGDITEKSKVYLPSYILLSREIEVESKKKGIKFIDVPDYYFLNELREVNEI